MRISVKEYEKLGRQFNAVKGRIGEEQACAYLINKKYKILQKFFFLNF